MAKMRADAPVMPPETLPRSSEVGEIDTRAPFQSVRDAVSLFRQVSFPKQQQQQQQQRLSSSTSSSQDAPDVSAEKETQLLLAEQEMERVQLCLDTSVKAKAKVLSDLDSAQRKAADLRAKLEATKQSRKSAIMTKHTMTQRLEQLQSENQETESVREDYILATAELFMAKRELKEIKQEFSITVEERLAELQKAEEAECSSVVNSRKIKDMTEEIAEMRDTVLRLNTDADKKKEEEVKINEKRMTAREAYAARKREAEQRLEDLRRDCDPELRKEIDELAEISAGNERLQEEIKLARELKEAKSEMQEICDEERSYKSLVGSLTVELDGVQRENRDLKENEKERREVEEGEWVEASRKVEKIMREAEETRQEAEEMRMHVDELRREAAATHMSMGEAVKQLEIVGKAVKKAKTAEKRAVEDMRVLTDKKESLTQDEPDKKIRISMKEYEELRGRHEESERMVQYKAKTVAAQLEEINASRVEGERMLEEKLKEMEEVNDAIDAALRNAEIAEEAHCIVDAELRKWKPQEL
ncbi:putative WEB family protein At4g17210 [Brassica napus]|nr:putative WEB family protein At4g17210 [Brassica napus]XP_048632767.1 putative WEB family protein At4g17210 [Brassica napus]XP_048632768.1 putative WEB family protein At4g17210 [Brassica napus]XP_048632769.1 putative WEB family protein At4g17210 [Brassica napus]XP_048632770.1 putative WEB family protein At4g17210 [Brassica napus]XP_048632771.1 putative WEB family protein At4g17210 [Brassica napus]XP_048632772.1 putative WEB family protein At4g17210 [Brassica napus]XP_048632773.1 putative W